MNNIVQRRYALIMANLDECNDSSSRLCKARLCKTRPLDPADGKRIICTQGKYIAYQVFPVRTTLWQAQEAGAEAVL